MITYDTAAIRDLVRTAFTPEDLKNFCFDNFPEIYNRFSNDSIDNLRQKVIEYAKEEDRIFELLQAIKQENPRRYSHYHQPLIKVDKPRQPGVYSELKIDELIPILNELLLELNCESIKKCLLDIKDDSITFPECSDVGSYLFESIDSLTKLNTNEKNKKIALIKFVEQLINSNKNSKILKMFNGWKKLLEEQTINNSMVDPKKPILYTPCFYNDLPNTGRHFIGRDNYLHDLDQTWSNRRIHILVIRAGFGGEGKSALVNEWLKEILRNPGKKEVENLYACTFHSQVVKDTGVGTSSDIFIKDALRRFGDPDPTKGSPIEKANRLANLVRQKRTLLILDSLEPLQCPYGPGEKWYLKDPAMRELLNELATNNTGLCIITTRAEVIELRRFLYGTVEEWKLPNLPIDSGKDLLKKLLNIKDKNSDEKLKKIAKDVEGHALTLILLGNYLYKACHGNVDDYFKIGSQIGLYEVDEVDDQVRLMDASEDSLGRYKNKYKFQRIMQAYENWLKDSKLLAILYLLGFFDMKVDMKAFEELKKTIIEKLPVKIPSGTNDWNSAISELREMGLILGEDTDAPDILDIHPFVRDYFAKRFEEKYLDTWKKGHKQLYQYYSKVAGQHSSEEGIPDFFKAIMHGCKAGLYKKALEDIYQNRIMRGNDHWSTNKFGTISSELIALSNFFNKPWIEPVGKLDKKSKAYVLEEAGFHLLALGRPKDAVEPTKQALMIWKSPKEQQNAFRAASRLSELYLTLGDLDNAKEYAERSEELADQNAASQQMAKANLAAVLHQRGDFDKSKDLLQKVAEMQKESKPDRPLLYSWKGFRYYDLLLDIGEKENSLEIFRKV